MPLHCCCSFHLCCFLLCIIIQCTVQQRNFRFPLLSHCTVLYLATVTKSYVVLCTSNNYTSGYVLEHTCSWWELQELKRFGLSSRMDQVGSLKQRGSQFKFKGSLSSVYRVSLLLEGLQSFNSILCANHLRRQPNTAQFMANIFGIHMTLNCTSD